VWYAVYAADVVAKLKRALRCGVFDGAFGLLREGCFYVAALRCFALCLLITSTAVLVWTNKHENAPVCSYTPRRRLIFILPFCTPGVQMRFFYSNDKVG